MKLNRNSLKSRDSGIVLVLCVVMIATLCFIAGTTMTRLRPELDGAGYFKNERRAFYNAEAGVQYAIDCISRDLSDGSLDLTNDVETVSYSAPSGYNFDTITSLRRMADGSSYMFSVTGRTMNARSIIEATIARPTAISLAAGVFGDDKLQLQPNIELYSYDSRVTINPTAADSTGKANAGSNGNIIVRPGVVLDGVFLLGADEFGFSPSPIVGYDNQEVGNIDPDPLGVNNNGMLASAFTYYSDAANNDNATGHVDGGDSPSDGKKGGGKKNDGNSEEGAITGDTLNMGPNSSATISGGYYYLEDIYIGPNSTLELDGTVDDPVVFFLTGGADIKPNSEVVATSGKPSSFFLFSNSSEEIKIFPNNDFMGFLYAPNALVTVQPNATVRGVFFAKDLIVKPGTASFIDTALLGEFRAPYVEIVQWRHVIE